MHSNTKSIDAPVPFVSYLRNTLYSSIMTSHDVRDMLDLPGSTGPRPAKKQKLAAPKSTLKGLAREVQSLGGDNPIAIVPAVSAFKKKRLGIRKPAARWELRTFTNSAREDSLVLRHWRRKPEQDRPAGGDVMEVDGEKESVEGELEDSTFAKFNVKVNVPTYDDELYTKLLESDDWSRHETDYLMRMAEDFDLRWPVIWDRYEYEPPAPELEGGERAVMHLPKERGLDDMKDRYYKISAAVMKDRKPLETMNNAEFDVYEKMKSFSAEQEKHRKKFAENAFHRTKEEAKEEESLLLELRRILARSERMAEDRKELYARLEAPTSTGANVAAFTSSNGLTMLLNQLAASNKAKNPRRSIMGTDGASPATGSGGPNGLDRRDSNVRGESVSGPTGTSNKKGAPPSATEHRQLTEDEERIYGVSHFADRTTSGPVFRWERLNRPITTRGIAQQAKIHNTLTELGIPARLIMPTAETGALWTNLIEIIIRMGDLKKAVEKSTGELATIQAANAERERRARIANGEPEEGDEKDASPAPAANADGVAAAQDGDVKMEDAREPSVARSTRGGSVHKRSASVLSTVSDKSTKRQKK